MSARSQNALVALEVMRLLLEVEHANRRLERKIEAARADEARLRDRISLLKAQINAAKADSKYVLVDLVVFLI